MPQQRCKRSRWLLPGMLLCRMLVTVVMVMDVELKAEQHGSTWCC